MSQAITRLLHARALIDRILDTPDLLVEVQALPPVVLTKLIHHVGLEDSGELIALASTEQLEQVFDEDLWKSERPGEGDTFDAARFVLWLEVLVEQGAAFAAKRVAELDLDLVTLALSKRIFVIDIEQLAQSMASDTRSDEEDQLDKQLESSLYHELDQYRIIARSHEGWDAILTLLVELYSHDHDTCRRILERCCDLSSEVIEDHGGLYEVLSAGEMVESDVAGEREDRREQLGHVPPSSALSFLKLALAGDMAQMLMETEPDPLTRAHLRALPLHANMQTKPERSPSRISQPSRLLASLREAEVIPKASVPRALPESARSHILLREALGLLREGDDAVYTQRTLELLYLANVLLAGLGTRAHRLRPVEAADAALALCELGASECVGAKGKVDEKLASTLAERLKQTSLVTLLRVGFKLACAAECKEQIAGNRVLGGVRELAREQGLWGGRTVPSPVHVSESNRKAR